MQETDGKTVPPNGISCLFLRMYLRMPEKTKR